MTCSLSAAMTPRKCETMQRSHIECLSCDIRTGQNYLTRTVEVELPVPVYEWLRDTGMEVGAAMVDLAYLASQEKLSVCKSALDGCGDAC